MWSKAQNIEFTEQQFETKEAYQEAIENLRLGDESFFQGRFKQALPYYLIVQEVNPDNALLNFKIGVAYLREEQFAKAKKHFIKAKQLDAKVDPKVDLAIAHSLKGNKEYEKALVSYKQYMSRLDASDFKEITLAQNYIDTCKTLIIDRANVVDEAKSPLASVSDKEPKPDVSKTTDQKVGVLDVKAKKAEKVDKKAKPVKKVEKTLLAEQPKEKISYKIQISSSKEPSDFQQLKKIYSGRLKITSSKYHGYYKYYIGDFASKSKALEALSMSGIKDAFLVKFVNGKRK